MIATLQSKRDKEHSPTLARPVTVSSRRFVILSVFLMVGCDLPGKPDPAERPVPADQVLNFATLYQRNCSGCHGADGKAGPAPPLHDPLFRAIVPEEDLKNIVAAGRKGTLMPAFAKDNGGTLTLAQIEVLVKEIKGSAYKVDREAGPRDVSPKWAAPPQPPKGAPAYRENSTAGDKEMGQLVFARACAVCHGSQGEGVERGGEMARRINDPVFLALISDQALRRIVITGRPDLGMPNYAEHRPGESHFVPLSDHEINNLVALLASWRGAE